MSTEIKLKEKNITDAVLVRVKEFASSGDLKILKNYSPENALKSAFLILSETKDKNNKNVLETCTQTSVGNALFSMVTQGLSPVKKQCYFIAYGDKLNFQRSYWGTVAMTKRDGGVKKVVASAVFKGDKFSFSVDFANGIKKITKHEQTLTSLSTEVVGAYAVLTMDDNSQFVEVMNIDQITKAWNQRQGNGLSPAHKNFPDEMAKKTVISRACKLFLSTSDDSALYDEEELPDVSKENMKISVEKYANQEIEDIEPIKEETIEPKNEEIQEAIKEEKIETNKPGF